MRAIAPLQEKSIKVIDKHTERNKQIEWHVSSMSMMIGGNKHILKPNENT